MGLNDNDLPSADSFEKPEGREGLTEVSSEGETPEQYLKKIAPLFEKIEEINSLEESLRQGQGGDEYQPELLSLQDQVHDIATSTERLREEAQLLETYGMMEQIDKPITPDNIRDISLRLANHATNLSVEQLKPEEFTGKVAQFSQRLLGVFNKQLAAETDPVKKSYLKEVLWANFEILAAAENTATEKLPFDTLSRERKNRYIDNLAFLNKVGYEGYKGGAHWFGEPVREVTMGDYILIDLITDPSRKISREEAEDIYQSEQDRYRIHLTIPPERKIEVLKAILNAKKRDGQRCEEILARRTGNGITDGTITPEELENAGGEAFYLQTFKMTDSIYNPNNVADFIFYPRKFEEHRALTIHEISELSIKQLSKILEPLNLPRINKLPRYSLPVVVDGKEIPGISTTQGSGDFKDALRQQHPDLLDRYYDPRTGWSIQTENPNR